MITLYVTGPNFGLPDASPFVTKADVLLKMSGLTYRTAPADFRKAPKGKVPYFDDDGFVFGDSTLLRLYLEDKHAVVFDQSFTAQERAVGWAFEKMAEDQLYWALVDARWRIAANFDIGPRAFFAGVPAPMRPLVLAMVKRGVARDMRGQGFGRHARPEIERLASRSLDAVAAQLGDKPWLLGAEPSTADASVWAMVTGILCPHFETPLIAAATRHPTLLAYRDRGLERWYPEFATQRV